MAFDVDDGLEVNDLVGMSAQFGQPVLEAATMVQTSGGYGGAGYGASSYAAHAPIAGPMTEWAQFGGNLVGGLTGALGMLGGIRDVVNEEHWLGKKGLGLANAVSGGIQSVGSFAGALGAESGFFGGLAGSAGATGTAAGVGAALSTGASVAGAGLAGIGLGMYGDQAFQNFGLFHANTTGEAQSITDASAEAAVTVGDYFGGGDSVGGQIAGNLTAGLLAPVGALGAIGSAVATPYVAGGRAVMNAVGHFAE